MIFFKPWTVSCQFAKSWETQCLAKVNSSFTISGRLFHVGFTIIGIFYNLICLKHYQRLTIRKYNLFQSTNQVLGTSKVEGESTDIKERWNKKAAGDRERNGVSSVMWHTPIGKKKKDRIQGYISGIKLDLKVSVL